MNNDNYFQSSFINSLNPEQYEVATHNTGPLLVLAGAGSGKTRCIIYRVAWLIAQNQVKPWNILVVTFTNKAANELRERINLIFNNKIKSTWVGTFHSVCIKILRLEISNLSKFYQNHFIENNINIPTFLADYNSNFTIFNRENQLSLLKKVYIHLNIDKKIYPVEKILSIISKQKSMMILPEDIKKAKESNKSNQQSSFMTDVFLHIYQTYQTLLKQENAMDFDDILLYTVLLLKNQPIIKEKYQDMFKYIMVDEYQDTNKVQFEFINQLSSSHQNICVVGDDDQSIYGWRGATIENILNFNSNFHNVKTIKLEKNYRSTKQILDIANQLIDNNKHRHKKQLWSDNNNEHQPQLFSHDNEWDEANYIAEDAINFLENNPDYSYKDIAVLYRTNFQSRIFESIFANKQIPYQVIGSFSFYERSEIKDLLSLLRYIINPADMEACFRIINIPVRGIGKTTLEYLQNYAFENNYNITQAILEVDNITSIKKKANNAIKQFSKLMQSLRELITNNQKSEKTLSDLIKEIIRKCHIKEHFSQLDIKNMTDKVENINEFINAAYEYEISFFAENQTQPSLIDFINNLSLQSDTDQINNKYDSVKLMTIHCAKGLEFNNVYIAGIEDGILPHIMSCYSEKEIEEERRLLYVAITRAKNYLQLHYSHSRRVAGTAKYSKKSRFLREINIDSNLNDKYYKELFNPTTKTTINPISETNENQIDNNLTKFYVNQVISHEKYGKGTIITIENGDNDYNLTVSFFSGQLKKVKGKWVKNDVK
ncbi:MAG: UvrD-helicase domain-containing protein [Candidatus Cloacimonetes bacterium]|nr:UvrD-helicase domain-containing protein [Candidatus Cloacimonadota bacterium]